MTEQVETWKKYRSICSMTKFKQYTREIQRVQIDNDLPSSCDAFLFFLIEKGIL